jgi:ParB/RepB/Spo0J family partition protein
MTKTATKKAAAPLLAKALNAHSMSAATEDLLTNPGWQPGETSALQYIALDDIYPAVDNPRSNLGDLTGLAASIAAVGILEPILVQVRLAGGFARDRGDSGGYSIVAGHRRHAAAKLAGLDLIPCLVRTFTEQARIEAMVIENLQRQDLSPFDEARGLTQLVGVGLSQRDIAERVGCSQSHVSKRLSLTVLPPAAEKLFVEESLSIRHVEELAKVPLDDLGAVVGKLVTRAKSYKDTLLPDWAIDNEISKLKSDRKHREAEKVGKASGLTRLKDRPWDYPGSSHRKCKKGEATHWYLGSTDVTVMWARTAAAHDEANPVVVVERPPNEWELRNAAGERIAEFVSVTIVTNVSRDLAAHAVFIHSVNAAARSMLDAGERVDAVPLENEIGDPVNLGEIDDELYVAFALLFGLVSPRWHLPALEIVIAHGYRTTGVGETFPEGFDPTPILITATEQ